MTLKEPESDLNLENKDKNCINFKASCNPVYRVTFSVNRLFVWKLVKKNFKHKPNMYNTRTGGKSTKKTPHNKKPTPNRKLHSHSEVIPSNLLQSLQSDFQTKKYNHEDLPNSSFFIFSPAMAFYMLNTLLEIILNTKHAISLFDYTTLLLWTRDILDQFRTAFSMRKQTKTDQCFWQQYSSPLATTKKAPPVLKSVFSKN